jgi:hypothetical protein
MITLDNIDALVDAGRIEVMVEFARNGKPARWWRARRNGATKRWKRDATRIALPIKAGMYFYSQIETADFTNGGRGFIRIAE